MMSYIDETFTQKNNMHLVLQKTIKTSLKPTPKSKSNPYTTIETKLEPNPQLNRK